MSYEYLNEPVYTQKRSYLAHNNLNFGDGRRFRLKYYQYLSTSAEIKMTNENSQEKVVDVLFDSKYFKKENENDRRTWRPQFSWHRLWLYTGPGWLMSIAYLDPGNLESDLQSGVIGGYQLIWVLFWATVLGWCLQTLASRLGVVTGKHLAQICRYEYSKKTALLLWLLTELAIIGSDIQEVVGSSIAFNLLFGWPLWLGCCITALDAFTFLLLHYLGMRPLEMFFCFLIATMALCFGANFVIGNPSITSILKGWAIPIVENHDLEQAVGMVGAVIMPHNLFLHSALVQTRNLQRTNIAAVREANYYYAIESAMSLFVSFFINLFIVAVFAKGFHDTDDSDSIGLHDAGSSLESQFGKVSKYVWGIGLLAAGQASTMTGTYAGQYAMQGFLGLDWAPWKRTLLTRSIALGPALLVALLATGSLDQLDEWLNVQQSVQLPFALLPLLFFNSNPRVVGIYALSKRMQIFYSIVSCIIVIINVYLIIEFTLSLSNSYFKWIGISLFMTVYLGFVFYLIYDFYFQTNKFRSSTTGHEISENENENENENGNGNENESDSFFAHDFNKSENNISSNINN